MADQITTCVVEKENTTIIKYIIGYIVKYEDFINQFCIDINVEEMIDPTDQNEAISKANIKAKVIKDSWIINLPSSTNEILISIPQNVVLE